MRTISSSYCPAGERPPWSLPWRPARRPSPRSFPRRAASPDPHRPPAATRRARAAAALELVNRELRPPHLNLAVRHEHAHRRGAWLALVDVELDAARDDAQPARFAAQRAGPGDDQRGPGARVAQRRVPLAHDDV